VPAATPTKAAPAKKASPAKQRTKPAEPEPLIAEPEPAAAAVEEPAEEPVEDVIAESVRLVDGLRVVADDPAPSPLPARNGGATITFRNLRILTLEDNSKTFGCGDCAMTGTRGEVQKHRYDIHDAPRPGRRAVEAAIPPDLADMTIGEMWAMRHEYAAWGHLVTELEVKLDDWRQRALAAEQWKRKVTARLAQIGFKLDEDDE